MRPKMVASLIRFGASGHRMKGPVHRRRDIGRDYPHLRCMTDQTTLERAFVLARSGDCATVNEIRARLKAERHDQVEAHLAGPSIKRQLARLCAESKAVDTADS
jgi:hypothetical protein